MGAAGRRGLHGERSPRRAWIVTGDPRALGRGRCGSSVAQGRERAVISANPTPSLWHLPVDVRVGVHRRRPPFSQGPRWWTDSGIDSAVGISALELLREVVDACAQRSLELDPVQVLDEIAGTGEALYTPLVFGYSTYALRREGRSAVTFCNAPVAGRRSAGTLTGGVGLGISGRSEHQLEAADFLLFATSKDVQRGSYAHAGGNRPVQQPGSTNASTSRAATRFLPRHILTMDHSFVRPRRAGYPRYQREAARTLPRDVQEWRIQPAINSLLNRMWRDVEST